MNDFLKNLWTKTKAWGIEAGYFLSSRVFLIDFGKMLLIAGGFLFLLFWGITCFSRHGQATQVGNYVTKNVKEVIKSAESQGFDIVITDSLYKEGFPPDLVIEQNPLPNTKVKQGRTIYLKITKAAGDLVTLPDIAGRDEISFYSKNLEMLGVKIGHIDSTLNAELVDGTIIKVLIHGRDVTNELQFGKIQVPQGSTVDFEVSKRLSDEAEIPAIEGNTADEYSVKLETLGLRVGTIMTDPSVTNQNLAKVYKTEPATGTILKKGSTVNIYIKE